MITIQEAHKYLNLVQLKMAKPILCPVDNEHLPLVSNIDEDDNVYFYCIACNTKLHPGEAMIKHLKLVISNFT